MNDEMKERIAGTVSALEAALAARGAPRLFAGADGFVDQIIRVVDKRFDAENFKAIGPIADYAKRVSAAAGKSTNIEFAVQEVKSGGNGPLMSEAFGYLGGKVRYAGSVGWPELDPTFERLKSFGPVHPVAPAAQTLAAEFEDGKIMYGLHQPLREVTWENFRERIGGVDALDACLRGADLVALLNWTMLPYLDDIFDGVAERVRAIGADAPKFYFFDLCDPAKRTREDLLGALQRIAAYGGEGRTAVLGLNEKESLELCEALGLHPGGEDAAALLARAEAIAGAAGVQEVVIHPTRLASAWSVGGGTGSASGPYCANPKLTTGAGDHFNGGYMFARVLNLDLEQAVLTGKMTSGFYVREGRGPSVPELRIFAERWAGGTLDPWQAMPTGI